MIRINCKNLLLSALLLLAAACSIAPKYSYEDIDDTIVKICQEEFDLAVNAWVVGNTLWVYAPLDILDDEGNIKIDPEGKSDDDLIKNIRRINRIAVRALLNMDKPPQFLCLIIAETKKSGIDYYMVTFVPDRLRLERIARIIGHVSQAETLKRIVQFDFWDSQALGDKEGAHIEKYENSIDEFITLLISQAMLGTLLDPEIASNYQIDELEVTHSGDTITITFDIMIVKYEPGMPRPLEAAEEIAKDTVSKYTAFSNITTVRIVDKFNEKTRYLDFKHDGGGGSTSYGEGITSTLAKLYLASFYMKLAGYHRNNQDLERAKKFYEKTINILPKYVYALIELGATYVNLNQPREAITYLRKALDVDPKNTHALFSLGVRYYNIGETHRSRPDYELALKEFESVQALKPDYPKILIRLGKTHVKLGNKKKALEYLEKASEKNPDDPEANLNLAEVYLDFDDNQKALEHAQRVLEIKKDFPGAHRILGRIYQILGDSVRAIENYQKALELEPNNFLVYHDLGNIYSSLGQHKKAIAAYKKVIEIQPNAVETYINLASIYREIGMAKNDKKLKYKALQYLRDALKIAPQNERVLYRMGDIYLQLKNYQKALEYFQQVLAINPRNANAYFTIGNVYFFLKDYDTSYEYFLAARDLFYQLGDYDNALAAEENIRKLPY